MKINPNMEVVYEGSLTLYQKWVFEMTKAVTSNAQFADCSDSSIVKTAINLVDETIRQLNEKETQ